MRVNGVQLTNFQSNFIKELMGDVFMTDTRAEALVAQISTKYGVNVGAMLNTAAEGWVAKNTEFKRLEAEDLARG